jgi:hypothetical protein
MLGIISQYGKELRRPSMNLWSLTRSTHMDFFLSVFEGESSTSERYNNSIPISK